MTIELPANLLAVLSYWEGSPHSLLWWPLCVCVGPQPPLTPANLFLAKHTLETFEMKPIAEEEEEEKVEVVKVPVVKPKSAELMQPRSGTATVVFGGSGSCAVAAGVKWCSAVGQRLHWLWWCLLALQSPLALPCAAFQVCSRSSEGVPCPGCVWKWVCSGLLKLLPHCPFLWALFPWAIGVCSAWKSGYKIWDCRRSPIFHFISSLGSCYLPSWERMSEQHHCCSRFILIIKVELIVCCRKRRLKP